MMRVFKLELKRILGTPLTIVLLLSALFLTVVMAYLPVTFVYCSYIDDGGNTVELTGFAAIAYEKDLQNAIAGAVTPAKVRQAVEDYQACLNKYGVKESYDLPDGVYETEILPFAPLVHGVREVFANPNTGIAPSLITIAPEKLDDFYGACESRVASLMAQEQKKYPQAQQAAVEMYNAVQKPYQFFPGYSTDAMDYQILLSFLIMLLCIVIAAPVFASDYQTGADAILRTTKYGRGKLALIKIVSALLISGVMFLLCAFCYIFLSNSFFGWESTKTSMQMLYSIINLPDMTIRELQRFVAIVGLVSILATISFTLFLSAKCQNVMTALATALVFGILPFIIYLALPTDLAPWIYGILPSSGAGIQTSVLYTAIDFDFLTIGNVALWLPQVMLGACVIEIPLFAALTMYAYHNKYHVK